MKNDNETCRALMWSMKYKRMLKGETFLFWNDDGDARNR